jgi:hypothetical protein
LSAFLLLGNRETLLSDYQDRDRHRDPPVGDSFKLALSRFGCEFLLLAHFRPLLSNYGHHDPLVFPEELSIF